MSVTLYPYQIDAINRMKNGCVVCGGVGSGKSLTAISYYYLQNGGEPDSLEGGDYMPMDDPPMDLYIITTARKRDTFEWEKEMAPFLLSPNSETNLYHNKVTIDSWNNIAKYSEVENAFFIFDEQRVVGSGKWVKSFLKIAKHNQWILLSATPGDTWSEYIPLFIANGFFKNRSEFNREHVVYSHYCTKFPKIERYLGERHLEKLRDSILIDMDFERPTVAHHEDVYVRYDVSLYKDLIRSRWDPWKNEPIENAGGLCYCLRKCVNSDTSRQLMALEIHEKHPKMIIFYSFDYELEILKGLAWGKTAVAEWNGHRHEPIPDTDNWIYLVNYSAGAEGWNCVETDTILFYSQNYSYKVMIQASGRIDRLNTPFHDLYYYHMKSRSGIDLAISRALADKKTFNESRFIRW